MNRKNIIIAVLLVLSIGTYMRIGENGTLRTVEFVSIFVIGALSGLLGNAVFTGRKN